MVCIAPGLWPRSWPLRRLRPFSPFPTKGAAKSAPWTPRGVQGVGRLSRVERRFFRARNPTGDGHCRCFGSWACAHHRVPPRSGYGRGVRNANDGRHRPSCGSATTPKGGEPRRPLSAMEEWSKRCAQYSPGSGALRPWCVSTYRPWDSWSRSQRTGNVAGSTNNWRARVGFS